MNKLKKDFFNDKNVYVLAKEQLGIVYGGKDQQEFTDGYGPLQPNNSLVSGLNSVTRHGIGAVNSTGGSVLGGLSAS